jgi:hypothetical protein
LLQTFGVFAHAAQGRVVVLVARDVEQLARIAQPGTELFQLLYDAFEDLAFLAELLSALRIAPDVGVFGQPDDFAQAQLFLVEVKDTSGALRRGFRRPRAASR